jgi:hypothetical protein
MSLSHEIGRAKHLGREVMELFFLGCQGFEELLFLRIQGVRRLEGESFRVGRHLVLVDPREKQAAILPRHNRWQRLNRCFGRFNSKGGPWTPSTKET